jgi:hypothetical protein
VHYIGGVGPVAGPGGQFGRLLAWLTGGAVQFAPCANPYDIVRLPDFEFGITHPEESYRHALHARFPAQPEAIERWFAACGAARHAALTLFALHSLPAWLAWGIRVLRGADSPSWDRSHSRSSPRIKRASIVSGWEDEAFVNARRATVRRRGGSEGPKWAIGPAAGADAPPAPISCSGLSDPGQYHYGKTMR